MRKQKTISTKGGVFVVLALLSLWGGLAAQEPCTAQQYEATLLERSDYYRGRQEKIEAFTEEWMNRAGESATIREIITIPVVVHILWYEETENLSDEQVASQIEALNADFRLLNADISRLPLSFAGLAADCGIEFCLASLDPDGFPSSGITRTRIEEDCIGQAVAFDGRRSLYYTELGGRDAWNPEEYLNIWVGNLCGPLGRSSFPIEAGEAEDGVVVDPANFGTLGIPPPYHLGRTLTHEVGHYFNLRHIWGDSSDECDDDSVADTPLQRNFYLGCPTHPQITCESEDLFMNFMNYTDDACMYMFTHGQKERMLAALNGPRLSLLSSKGCALNKREENPLGLKSENVKIIPNPTTDRFVIRALIRENLPADIEIFNITGQLLMKGKQYIRESRPIELSHLPNGVYFVKITVGRQSVVKKVMFVRE
jgi:hypothetical protein